MARRKSEARFDNLTFSGSQPYRCAWKCRDCGHVNNEQGERLHAHTYVSGTILDGYLKGCEDARSLCLAWAHRINERYAAYNADFGKLNTEEIDYEELLLKTPGVCAGCGRAEPWGVEGAEKAGEYATLSKAENKSSKKFGIFMIVFALLLLAVSVLTAICAKGAGEKIAFASIGGIWSIAIIAATIGIRQKRLKQRQQARNTVESLVNSSISSGDFTGLPLIAIDEASCSGLPDDARTATLREWFRSNGRLISDGEVEGWDDVQLDD